MQRNSNFKILNPNNSMYNEIVYRLDKGNSLSFNDCDGYEIIGMHSWNLENSGEITKLGFGIATAHCASIHLRNKIMVLLNQLQNLIYFAKFKPNQKLIVIL